MKTIAILFALVAAVYADAKPEAEADPQFWQIPRANGAPSGFVYHYQTYHNDKTPASTAPLAIAPSEEGEQQKLVVNPYAGLYHPYHRGLYNGLYNGYYNGLYSGYPYGFGVGGYPYNYGYPYGGAWNGYYGGYPRIIAGTQAAAQ